MNKNFFVVVGLLVMISVGYRIVFFSSVSGAENPQKKPVVTVNASESAFQETAQFSGFIAGAEHADITPKVSGYIVKLTKEEGDTVVQGEILAVLDGNELSAVQKSALLSVESLHASLKTSEKYYRQKVAEAKTALENASGSAAIASAEEALRSAKRLRDAEGAALKTQQVAAEGQALIAGASVADIVIRAPFAGVITRKNASLGSFSSPGVPIYTLSSPDVFEVVVALPNDIAARVAKNSEVSITGGATSRVGYVFSVISSAEENRQRSVARVRITASSAPGLHLGDYVQVSFVVGTPCPTLFIPKKAILSVYDETFVYVVEEGRAKKRSVVLGVASGDHQEIMSGLSLGTHVVTEGAFALSDNQPVAETYVEQN